MPKRPVGWKLDPPSIENSSPPDPPDPLTLISPLSIPQEAPVISPRVIVGSRLTVTVAVAVLTHPLASVPVTT